MDKGNSFFFSHWNLALTFLTFVFRIDMHTHFAAPQKRGYTHTLGLAPLPREPIDTSISNMGFLCTSTWWQLCYGETSSPGKLDWIGRGIWWRPWWIYTLPNVRPGFRTPPKKKKSKPHWPSGKFWLFVAKVAGFLEGEIFSRHFLAKEAMGLISKGASGTPMATAGDFPPFFFHPTPSCRCVKFHHWFLAQAKWANQAPCFCWQINWVITYW